MNVQISIDLSASHLAEFAQQVTGPSARAALNNAMGEGVREITRAHLQELALSRHSTAQRLGASPTGHLEMAARAVEETPVQTTSEAATLTINHPGLSRAFGDVTILPKKQALTIPIAAMAYGRRAGEFGDQLYVWKSPTTGNAFLALRQEEKHASPLLLYLLVRSVTQQQDRSLLPSDSEWQEAALESADTWFQEQIASAV